MGLKWRACLLLRLKDQESGTESCNLDARGQRLSGDVIGIWGRKILMVEDSLPLLLALPTKYL